VCSSEFPYRHRVCVFVRGRGHQIDLPRPLDCLLLQTPKSGSIAVVWRGAEIIKVTDADAVRGGAAGMLCSVHRPRRLEAATRA
jgi:hypothetical protein